MTDPGKPEESGMGAMMNWACPSCSSLEEASEAPPGFRDRAVSGSSKRYSP